MTCPRCGRVTPAGVMHTCNGDALNYFGVEWWPLDAEPEQGHVRPPADQGHAPYEELEHDHQSPPVKYMTAAEIADEITDAPTSDSGPPFTFKVNASGVP